MTAAAPDWWQDGVVPDWLWDILDAHRPSNTALTAWLEAASSDTVVHFQLAYEMAAEAVSDYWSGSVVDGVPFSEDDTEDLCKWVVAQGRHAWEAATSGRESPETIARCYLAHEATRSGPPPWSPGDIAHATYFKRFEESLDERITLLCESAD